MVPLARNKSGTSTCLAFRYSAMNLPRTSYVAFAVTPLSRWSCNKKCTAHRSGKIGLVSCDCNSHAPSWVRMEITYLETPCGRFFGRGSRLPLVLQVYYYSGESVTRAIRIRPGRRNPRCSLILCPLLLRTRHDRAVSSLSVQMSLAAEGLWEISKSGMRDGRLYTLVVQRLLVQWQTLRSEWFVLAAVSV